MATPVPERQWHALIIGVDCYPAFPARQLSGCVNDANAIRQFLIDRVQLPEANTRLLISPGKPAASSAASAATAANIRAEFVALSDRVRASDHVVLFYAGHGVQISAVAAAGAKPSYYGFAPEDTAKSAEGYANLILGSEVHGLLKTIEAKGATATVIADTCHSGASTRAIDDDPRERVLRVEPLSETEWRDFSEHHPAIATHHGERSVADVAGRFGAYPGGDYVMLTGCLDSETSKEDFAVLVDADGAPTTVKHGLLTLALLKELEAVTPDDVRSLRWMDFYDRLRRTVAQRTVEIKSSSQTVSLEGRREKSLFGGEWRPFAPGFTVRVNADRVITIDGGELHGLSTDAVIAIYPPETSDFDNASVSPIEAVVETATPMTSTVRLVDATGSVPDLSRARLVRASANTPPIVVRIPDGSESVTPRMREVMVRESGGTAPFTLVADPVATPAHAELRRWNDVVPANVWPAPAAYQGARDGWVLVRTDRFGAPSLETHAAPVPDSIIGYLPAAGAPIEDIPAGQREDTFGVALAQGLSAYGRYLQQRDRQASDTTLASMLKVTLRAGEQDTPPTGAELAAIAPLDPIDGVYTLTEKHWMMAEIRVQRATTLRLQVGWVMFSDDGNVTPLWPIEGGQPTWTASSSVFVGYGRDEALSLPKRADQQTSMYTLAVIATTGPGGALPLNLASLAQRSVQAEFADALDRARGLQNRGEPVRRSAAVESPAWYAWNLRIAIGAAKR